MGVQYVLDLREVDAGQLSLVGGKAAQLGALTDVEGVRVPPGFVVTTEAYAEAVSALPVRDRRSVGAVALPEGLVAAVTEAVGRADAGTAWAVRSSATAEDLPTASFAGQQDTYLNVVGAAAVLDAVRGCWASLFNERAVAYRRRAGVDERAVLMGVVVQEMVAADAAGVLFTADPVSGDRRTATIDAGYGLGEALVSGTLTPDTLRVRDGRVVERGVAVKERAVRARPGGGTEPVPVPAGLRERPVLGDGQAVRLVELGRRIEAAFGAPQDIEWCLVGDGEDFRVVQSRPITTLFPVPGGADGNRVYLSVGHQQMMTDAMRPLGLSVWRATAMAPMVEAGSRLFVDATRQLASPAHRDGFLDLVGRGDPLVRDALETVLGRADFPLGPVPDSGRPPARRASDALAADPEVVAGLVARSEASVAALAEGIRGLRGPELFAFLDDAFAEHRRVLGDPLSMRAVMAGMEATWWLDDRLREWLGPGGQGAVDTLTLSAPGNVTSEMGLALLDVADAVRPHPEVVAFLRGLGPDADFLDALDGLDGGPAVRRALDDYLGRYGARCVGEIDVTRPRWHDRPATLVPMILDHVRNTAPGEAARRYEDGLRRAREKEREVLARLRELPDGAARAAETAEMIERVRTFIGYREYPKYGIVRRYAVYREALVAEAGRLVAAGVIGSVDDAFYLTLEELRDGGFDAGTVDRRRAAFRAHQALTPPRVLTSDGEAVDGAYRREGVPEGALTGLPVSAGTVEGRARVVRDLDRAGEIGPGDILVTAFTDPSWAPLFVGVAGLVTEVGGLMTHGAVIAREYGLPAVVGVAGATRQIRDGQRIRVHGTGGYVELLP